MSIDFWRDVVSRDFQVPADRSIADLTPSLLGQLGSPSSELRETSFSVLGEWIARGLYSPGDLRLMREALVRNLSAGIGEAGSDGVFVRSFSALVVGKIVEHDADRRFLSDADLHATVDAGSAYLVGESDLRSYVPEYGWIHTPAHAADLLRALGEHPGVTARSLERILDAIADKVTRPVDVVYIRMEDERLAAAAKAVLERPTLAAPFAHEWIEGIARPSPGRLWPDLIEGSEAEVNAWHNTRDFLRSLYFQITLRDASSDADGDVSSAIASALILMDLGFY